MVLPLVDEERMPRRVRIETPGYHHIYNRGVEWRFVYEEESDKEKFLQILWEVSEHYAFTVHSYVLMDNHYHLLVENQREPLHRYATDQLPLRPILQ